MNSTLNPFLESLRQAASARSGSRGRAAADAAICAFACFFLQAPRFIPGQRELAKRIGNSNCRTLFGVKTIPTDEQIRDRLEGLDPDRFTGLFHRCLETLRDQDALTQLQRLGGRLPVALEAIGIRHSDYVERPDYMEWEEGFTFPGGASAPPLQVHSLLAATVVSHDRKLALPLMPAFPAPSPDGLGPSRNRKQDAERSAAEHWLAVHGDGLRPYRPIILGDAQYCWPPLCRLTLDCQADFLFVCKPKSHKHLFDSLDEAYIQDTGWITIFENSTRLDRHRLRWMHEVPMRGRDGTVQGTWIERSIERNGRQTSSKSFFSSLDVTADNVAEVASLGRARWSVTEKHHCLARGRNSVLPAFVHDSEGLAHQLATLNLLAFALHTVLDCVPGPWKQCRTRDDYRPALFERLRWLPEAHCFLNWDGVGDLLAGRPTSKLAPEHWKLLSLPE